ncbi:MAG: radical SAM family heme chaperone HemW [Balneolia bacterium]|nr:radical SAM family heme chaperone HemW [Balneolia bacterium]
MAGLYIHIPFCKQACTYCDFYFETSRKHRADFVHRLLGEMEMVTAERPDFTSEKIETIYFGGGTPSQLTAVEINQLLEKIRLLWNVSMEVEITLEMNPDDVKKGYLAEIVDAGINRISMGVQTFNPERLRFMNRAHSREEAHLALEALQQSGCRSWTADLIYGNPDQDEADLMQDIDALLEYNPPHVSAYSLTVEPKTKLGSMVRKNIVKPAEDDLVSRHMKVVTESLGKAGIERYEVSNFARPGHESRHNSSYWTHTNYLGLGPSAHSLWWDADGKGATRWSNEPKLAGYMQRGEENSPLFRQFEPEFLDKKALAEERMLIGLRTARGVKEESLAQRYNYKLNADQRSWIARMRKEGYIQPERDGEAGVRLSDRGLMLADYIALQIISRG